MDLRHSLLQQGLNGEAKMHKKNQLFLEYVHVHKWEVLLTLVGLVVLVQLCCGLLTWAYPVCTPASRPMRTPSLVTPDWE